MKISRSQLRKLIMEAIENSIEINKELSISAINGRLKANNHVYALSSSGVNLTLKSIEKVVDGIKVTITPPKIPLVSDGKDRTGVLSGEKLKEIQSKVMKGMDSFFVLMDDEDKTKITFTKS